MEKKRSDIPAGEEPKSIQIIRSTRRGDGGKTKLLSGERVSKSSLRIEAGGNLDESNAALGLAKSLTQNEEIRTIIAAIQRHLVLLGAEISSRDIPCKGSRIAEEQIEQLEKWIEELQKSAPLPRHFVDPGANPVSAALDLARSVIRRTERSMVLLQEKEPSLSKQALSYVNRLACLIFTLARYAEKVH